MLILLISEFIGHLRLQNAKEISVKTCLNSLYLFSSLAGRAGV